MRVTLILAAMLALGVSDPRAENAHASQTIPFTRLHSGAHSGFTRLSEFVIRDQDEFARRWRGVQQGAPDAALPTMDFEKSTVVFVAMGSRNTGGYSVRIDSITSGTSAAKSGATATHYTVFYTTTSPGARCMSLQELTSPLDVISFEATTGDVKFKKSNVKSGC